jgi:hypothetical protein
MLCSEYAFQYEIQKDLIDLFKQIKILVSEENILQTKSFSQIENLLVSYKEKSNIKNVLYKYVINLAIEAEIKSAGAFIEVFKFLQNYIFDQKSLNLMQETIDLHQNKKTNLKDLEWLLEYFKFDLKLKTILFDTISLSGFNGKILVEKGNDKFKTIIEKINGFVFDLPMKDTKYFGNYANPRLIMIDGFVENVSEIHVLLEKSSESKECLIVFHRGMSDDVLNTLSVNWNRGTLRVVPVQVPYDLEGMNTLNDLAVISLSDVVSSLKGQLISSIRYEDLTSVDRLEITNNKIILINKKCDKQVKTHVQELLNKRSKVHDEIVSFYDKRIKTLSSNLVTIKLCDDIFYLSNRQKIDKFLRSYRNFISSGVIEFNDQKMLTATAQEIVNFVPVIYERLNEIGCVLCAN